MPLVMYLILEVVCIRWNPVSRPFESILQFYSFSLTFTLCSCLPHSDSDAICRFFQSLVWFRIENADFWWSDGRAHNVIYFFYMERFKCWRVAGNTFKYSNANSQVSMFEHIRMCVFTTDKWCHLC